MGYTNSLLTCNSCHATFKQYGMYRAHQELCQQVIMCHICGEEYPHDSENIHLTSTIHVDKMNNLHNNTEKQLNEYNMRHQLFIPFPDLPNLQSIHTYVQEQIYEQLDTRITKETQEILHIWSKDPSVPSTFINEILALIQKIAERELDPGKFIPHFDNSLMSLAYPNMIQV